MLKTHSYRQFLDIAIMLFLLFGTYQIAASQNNIYLEPNIKFDGAYPGLQITSDGKYLIKGFTWTAVAKTHPLNLFIFDAKTFRFLKTISTAEQGYEFWTTDNSKNVIAMTWEKGAKAEYFNIESGKKVSEKKTQPLLDVIQDSIFLIQPGFKDQRIYNSYLKSEIEFESSTGKMGKFCNNAANVLTIRNGTIILWEGKRVRRLMNGNF